MIGEIRIVKTGGPGLLIHPGKKGPRRRKQFEPERSLEDGCRVVVQNAIEKKYRDFQNWLKVSASNGFEGWVAAVYTVPVE